MALLARTLDRRTLIAAAAAATALPARFYCSFRFLWNSNWFNFYKDLSEEFIRKLKIKMFLLRLLPVLFSLQLSAIIVWFPFQVRPRSQFQCCRLRKRRSSKLIPTETFHSSYNGKISANNYFELWSILSFNHYSEIFIKFIWFVSANLFAY